VQVLEGRLVPLGPLKSEVVDLVETINLSLGLTLAVAVARVGALIPLSATTRLLATLATLETMLLPGDSGGVLGPAATKALSTSLGKTPVAFQAKAPSKESSTVAPLSTAPLGALALSVVSSNNLAFNRELDRVRAEEALVADKRELGVGALREGRVVMVAEAVRDFS